MAKNKSCRLALNYCDFDEGMYTFVPFTFDVEEAAFVDHWDEAVEAKDVPDHLRCVGFIGDEIYHSKGYELMKSGDLKIGVSICQNEDGEMWVE